MTKKVVAGALAAALGMNSGNAADLNDLRLKCMDCYPGGHGPSCERCVQQKAEDDAFRNLKVDEHNKACDQLRQRQDPAGRAAYDRRCTGLKD